MIITRESIGELNDIITIKISESDYKEKVDNSLKAQSKKVKLPGFRPGTVPLAHVQKLYGKEILSEQVNKILSNSLQNYLKENNLQLLGNPIPLPELSPNSILENQENFEFRYEIGLAPTIEITELPKGPIKFYSIKLDQDLLNSKISNLRRAYGKITHPEFSELGDILSLNLEINGTITNMLKDYFPRKVSLNLDSLVHEDYLQLLSGLKVGDQGIINLWRAFREDPVTMSKFLDISEEEASKVQFDLKFEVLTLGRIEPANLDSDFFQKYYPDGNINTEEEFIESVSLEIKNGFENLAQNKLDKELVLECLKHFTSVLPHQFLRKWLLSQRNSQYTEENLSTHYPDFEKSLKWSIISDNLAKKYNIEVKAEEMISSAKERIRNQLKLYSPEPVTDQELEEYSMRILQNQEQANQLFEEVRNRKILDFLRGEINLVTVQIDYQDFMKLK